MSAAAAISPPIPPAGPMPETGQPTRAARLHNLLRKFVDYGKELVATLRERNETTNLVPVMRAFGTTDIVRIIARIMCGLHRVQVLDDRILHSTAPSNVDPKPQAARSPRGQPATRPAAQRLKRADPDLVPLPTPQQIAAKVRRQSIAAVITDICLDLGITLDHPLWRELEAVIVEYNSNCARLVSEILRRPWRYVEQILASDSPVQPLASACATGPP